MSSRIERGSTLANIKIVNEKTIQISVNLEDAVRMVNEAARDVSTYARDIVTIYEKMPAFDYTSFCFYAYDSACCLSGCSGWIRGTTIPFL